MWIFGACAAIITKDAISMFALFILIWGMIFIIEEDIENKIKEEIKYIPHKRRY